MLEKKSFCKFFFNFHSHATTPCILHKSRMRFLPLCIYLKFSYSLFLLIKINIFLVKNKTLSIYDKKKDIYVKTDSLKNILQNYS